MPSLDEVTAQRYRSLRQIRFPVRRLSVFVGPNGSGKTNLYRALQLLQAAAAGTLARELAAEGGLASASWAGELRKTESPRILLGASFDAGDLTYQVEVGAPGCTDAAFELEPQVKEETLVHRHGRRTTKLLDRRGAHFTAVDESGRRVEIERDLMASETALGLLRDPTRFPDLDVIREALLDWRFYHEFRTDRDSPLRRPCLAVTAPTLASDGGNLAAVLATLRWIRQDTVDLDRAIDDAFPGARLELPPPGEQAEFGLVMPDFPRRVFAARELSDGTLRFLALAGALLAYRLPGFVALNEPEASLHPDLLEPLARLIVRAAERTQVWLVTHSERLAAAIGAQAGIEPLRVFKREGATWIEGLTVLGSFRDPDE